MHSAKFLFFSLALTIPHGSNASMLGWLWGSSSEPANSEPTKFASSKLPVPKVQFEAKSAEDKFIEAVQRYSGRESELDACQHKVVMQVQSSCSKLSEEELAKLSVNLLNCQAAAEGRQQFPCTPKMSLRDCTKSMDSDMWNAYHLMNNRARSVCYASRQEQFRASAEMTVDHLMDTARRQVSAMDSLRVGQEQLGSLTASTLEHQESLLRQQQGLQQFVGDSLRDLVREKKLIAAGHRELARMTDDVRRRLEAANEQLDSQSTEQRVNHEQLLSDLTTIQRQASDIWAQVERSTREVLNQQHSAARQYRNSLQRLHQINATIDYLLRLMETSRLEMETRLGWITELAGNAGDSVDRLVCAGKHCLLLLGGALLAAFLNAPSASRLTLVLLIPINICIILQNGVDAALGITEEAVIITVITIVNWAFNVYYSHRQQSVMSSPLHENDFYKIRHSTPAPNGSLYQPNHSPLQQSKQTTIWSRVKSTFSHLVGRARGAVLWCVPRILRSRWMNVPTIHASPLRLPSGSRDSTPLAWNAGIPSPPIHSATDSSDDDMIADDDDGLFGKGVSDVGRVASSPLSRFNFVSSFEAASNSTRGSHENLSAPTSGKRTPPTLRYRSPHYSPPTPSVSSRSATPRLLCGAICRSGLPCRNSATAGSSYCYRHADSDGASFTTNTSRGSTR